MNLQPHGVEGANLTCRDSLAEEYGRDADAYSLILANPPFSGSLDCETTAKDLLKIVKTMRCASTIWSGQRAILAGICSLQSRTPPHRRR